MILEFVELVEKAPGNYISYDELFFALKRDLLLLAAEVEKLKYEVQSRA